MCLLSQKCYYHLIGRYEQWKVQLQEEREREWEREGDSEIVMEKLHHSVSLLQHDF